MAVKFAKKLQLKELFGRIYKIYEGYKNLKLQTKYQEQDTVTAATKEDSNKSLKSPISDNQALIDAIDQHSVDLDFIKANFKIKRTKSSLSLGMKGSQTFQFENEDGLINDIVDLYTQVASSNILNSIEEDELITVEDLKEYVNTIEEKELKLFCLYSYYLRLYFFLNTKHSPLFVNPTNNLNKKKNKCLQDIEEKRYHLN